MEASVNSAGNAPVFLRAEWRKLMIVNYAVLGDLLGEYIPHHTEPDLFNGNCLVSLVGFRFINTKLKGIPVPFHRNFTEVNLRFYVRRNLPGGICRRGVVFIREIVPLPALSLVANLVYGEHYETRPVRHELASEAGAISVAYEWKKKAKHRISVVAENNAEEIKPFSAEEFITEHYWGYTKLRGNKTAEYAVEHERWKSYPVKEYEVKVDFGLSYGKKFAFLSGEKPVSVMLAEGSEII
ncbi:MAG TPA: DUF2071 domain-containing protein, partial [Bacteroidia bacterium]|nr:DUF2071 domain-containing protein [Bacteroidia bacterium]